MAFKDLTGQKFGKLTVLGIDHKVPMKGGGYHRYYKCRCECGNETVVLGGNLKSGHTKSCGCLHKGCQIKDLTGEIFGRLTVLEFAYTKNEESYWKCCCSCGAEIIVRSKCLARGETKSCGCLALENLINRSKTHGLAGTPIHIAWCSMRERCNNPHNKSYARYGGRGIKICERWLNSFENFYEDVSKLPHFGEKGYSLDRINNDGDYCPDNVRWATRKEQCRNRRSNVIVEYQGVKMTMIEAAEKSGLDYKLLNNRYRKGKRGDELFCPVNIKYLKKEGRGLQ